MLAPAARSASQAVVGKSSLGWAIVWNEQVGDKGALRFLAVDNAGLPRSPSAEVVDRAGALLPDVVQAEGQGHLVMWREGTRSYQRLVDAQGRPRGDVIAIAEGTIGVGGIVVQSACQAGADAVRCKTRRGTDLVLPAGSKILEEELGDAGDLVLATDASGLQLYALDCSAR